VRFFVPAVLVILASAIIFWVLLTAPAPAQAAACPPDVRRAIRYTAMARVTHERWAEYMQGGWASPLEVKMHGGVDFQLTWVRRYRFVERVLLERCAA